MISQTSNFSFYQFTYLEIDFEKIATKEANENKMNSLNREKSRLQSVKKSVNQEKKENDV